MQFALVSNERREALPGLSGICPGCGEAVIAKCGTQRMHHWAHRSKRTCDFWWESETVWHRSWKSRYPSDWREVVVLAADGERHIADVRTPNGLVLEFQHSFVGRSEQDAREAAHKNLVWIVDGTRLKRDFPRFMEGLTRCRWVGGRSYLVHQPENMVPPTWANRSVPILFDFQSGAANQTIDGEPHLWCLWPGRISGYALLSRIRLGAFLEHSRSLPAFRPHRSILSAALLLVSHKDRSPPKAPRQPPRRPTRSRRRYPLTWRQYQWQKRRRLALPRF